MHPLVMYQVFMSHNVNYGKNILHIMNGCADSDICKWNNIYFGNARHTHGISQPQINVF